MKTCGYIFLNKEKYTYEFLKNSEFFILHIDLPEDESSEEFREIKELKRRTVQ
ncbi:MAG: hypothetical protein GKB99_00510 [Methanocellales archaeon]|nr:hypothetical protein [Methanocellales archaeon]